MVAELGDDAGTPKPPRAPTSKGIVKLIRALVARRLVLMTENPMADGEQEQKLLEIIARNMAKLEDLNRSRRTATGTPARQRPSKALLDLRRRIAHRIEQLEQG